MYAFHTFHILRPVACFVISSHILMSQFFRIGPISLSNLVNSAILLFPRGGGVSTSGYHANTLPFDASALNGVEGEGAEGFCVEVGGGGERRSGGEAIGRSIS